MDDTQAWLRALHWVLTQPSLLDGLPGGAAPLFEPSDPRLSELLQRTEEDPSGLMALLQGPRAHKVGIAYEALMIWGITQGLGYQCLARDLQVYGDGRTLGALDLVLRAPDGRVEHWELAYKVYLQARSAVSWESWIGPGQRDRLDIKVRRLLDHQLPLSGHGAAESSLKRLELDGIDLRRVVLRGVLFSPWGSEPVVADGALHPAQGRWIRPSQIDAMLADRQSSRWLLREKPHWFGPWRLGGIDSRSSTELRDRCRRPVERAELWTCSQPHSSEHDEVFFLVPEGWGHS